MKHTEAKMKGLKTGKVGLNNPFKAIRPSIRCGFSHYENLLSILINLILEKWQGTVKENEKRFIVLPKKIIFVMEVIPIVEINASVKGQDYEEKVPRGFLE